LKFDFVTWYLMHRSCTNFNLSLLSLSGWVKNYISLFKYVLVCTGMYCLVQMWNSHIVMYSHVLVCTSTYRNVPICQILSRGTGFQRNSYKSNSQFISGTITLDINGLDWDLVFHEASINVLHHNC
jgi:hypothetical protein